MQSVSGQRRYVMAWWNDEQRWVSEDGLRCYFVLESDRGGPSRLDCYRRMLTNPPPAKPSRRFSQSSAWWLTDLVDFTRSGWRRFPAAIATVSQIVGQ